jgi:hypothetical protein
MQRTTLFLIFFIFIFCASVCVVARAEIDAPTKKFIQSKVVKDHLFEIDTTVEAGIYSTTPGKEKIIYKAKGGRYLIELLTEKKGASVSVQTLNFPYSEKPQEADQDRGCALDFFKEATGSRVDERIFTGLFDQAKQRQGILHETASGSFIISVIIYRHALYREWSIAIKKKEK